MKHPENSESDSGQALASVTCSGNPPHEITYKPTYRYTLQWNFGKSQCSFDTAQDVADFIRDELTNIEAHCPNKELSTRSVQP